MQGKTAGEPSPAPAALFPTDASLTCSDSPHVMASAVFPGNLLERSSNLYI